jgi:hypothetical protein
MNKPSGSFLAWENTLCNTLDHPRIQSQNAWEDGYASGVAAEREACAKVCDAEANDPAVQRDLAFQNMARIIRELKEEQQGGQE